MSTTVSAKPAEVRHDWYVVDAEGKTLGRLASEIAGEPAPSSLARVKFVFPRILNAQELPSVNARNIGKS